jgi:hypothetical protein
MAVAASFVDLLALGLKSFIAIKEVEPQVSEKDVLSRTEKVAMKFKNVIDAEKRVIRTASTEIARAMRNSVRVFRIIIFLHSAKDFPSVLRLYGVEVSSETD